MAQKKAGLFPYKRLIAGIMAVVFLGTTVSESWAEASFWSDRRKAREKFSHSSSSGASAPLLLASANSLGSAFGNARPVQFEPTSVSLSREERALQLPILKGVPLSSVMVRETYVPASSPRRWVVHIQDVHAQYEAQKNIASAVESLSTTHKAPRLLVGLEGAQGSFFLDAFRTFPDKETLVDVSDAFLKKNILTGAEYAALVAPHGLDLWGVEDRALYDRHVKSVVDAVPLESEFRKTLADFSHRVRVLKAKEYPADLKAWDKAYETYHSEKSSLGDYVRLIAVGERRGAFPQVEKFLDALETEHKLDFAQAERERKWLVDVLAARLSPTDLAALTQRALAFRAGRVGVGAFHEELISLAGKVGVTSKGFQEFLRYLNYVKRVEEIDRNDLLNEIDGQEKAHVARLLKSTSPRVREIQAVARDLVMADKLLRHALTPSEWAEYKKNAANFRSLPDRLAQLETGRPAAAGGFAEMVRVLEEFYRAASDRDRVLVDNLFARMGEGAVDKPAVAVLVAGGFHSDGVTALIKQRGAAYVTLTPRFEVVNGQDSLDVFRQQKTPLDRLFAGEKLNLVEPLAGASSSLQGGNDRATLLRAMGVPSLLVSSTLGAESLDAWLATVKQSFPGFVYERTKSEGQSGYLTTLPDERQIFVWETETPGAFKWAEFKNGVVNTRAYTPTLLARIPSLFSKFKKGGFLTGKSVATAVVVGGALFSFPMLTVSNVAGILLLTSLYLLRQPILSFVSSKGGSSAGFSQEIKPAGNGPAVAAILPLLVAGALWMAAIYFGIPLLADQLTGWQAALNAIAGSDISTFVGAIAFFGAKLVGVFGALVSLTPTVAMLTGLAVLGRMALSFPIGERIFSLFIPKTPANTKALAESAERGTSELKQGKIVSGVTHLLVDVMGTLYNFAFVQADRAFQLMVNGKLPDSVLAGSPLTYTEKKYLAFRETLNKRGFSPFLTATISAFALPLIALQGIVVRRLYLMVLSTISNIGLTLATGKILMVIAPVFGFDPVLALATIVGFSLLSSLDLIFGEGWTAQYAQKSEVFRSLVLVASPFAAVNSFFLAFLMTSIKLIKQGGIKPALTGQWWKGVGVQSFQSAFGKSLSFSGVLGSIHMVGFEIAVVKWFAHLTGGPVETVLLSIEGPQNSVLGAGNQVASAAGLGDVGSSLTAVTNEGRAYSVRDVQSLSAQGLPRISWAMQRLEQNPNDPVAREVLAGEPATVIANLTRHIAELPASVRGPLETLAKKPSDVQARLAVQSILQGIIDGSVNVGDSKEVIGLIAHGLPLMADLQRQGRATGSRDQRQLVSELNGWSEKGGAALLLAGPRERAPSVSRWEQIKTAWGKIGTAHAAENDRSVGPETPSSAPQTQGPVETVVAAGVRSLENILPGAEAGKTPGTVEVTVQKGMTVGGIVRALTLAGALLPGVATAADMRAAIQNTNGLNAGYLIKEGQRLVIPLDPAVLVRVSSPPSAATETASVSAPKKAAIPDLPGADSGPVRGVPIDTLTDVSRLVKQSLASQRDAAKLEADRLREQAKHPIVQAAPGAGVGAHVGGGESGVSVEVASRLRSDSLSRYAEVKRWAEFTDADIELMARDRTRQAGEALLSYRAVSETLKIKRESLRALESIPQQGTPETRANLNQALKLARDDVRLLEKAEQEAAREAKNLLGLRVKDDVRVKGGFFIGAEGQKLDVYEARIRANSAKIHALAQELGTEGADEVARFFKDTLRIEASASWFNESGSKPLPQLGLSLDLKALDKGDIKKEFAERVQKAVELFNLKVANEQLRVEGAQARDHAVQQLRAIRENAKEARTALAAAEEFLKDQSANYTAFNGAETEGSGLVRAIRLREEALARVLAVQTAEMQARAQFRFAGGTGDPESVAPVSAPLGRDEVAKLEISRLIDTAIKQRLGFSEKDIENAAHEGGWEKLAGKMNANLRVNGTFYKGGSPVAVTFGVLLRDSNAETKGERAQLSLARAEMLVKAARNQVANEVTSSYLALRDAQEAQRLAIESQGLQDKLVPTDSAHASYFDRKAQSAAGRARLFDAKTNELTAWRSLQSAVGVDPAKAGDTFRGLTGSVAHDPTHAVEVSKGYYDPKADKALAADMQVRIAELGLKMATNTDQYWDPKIGFAVTPTGGVVPLIWTDRLANIPAAILSPLTWPFRAANGDTRFFISPLDDRINAETKLAKGEVAVAQEDKDFQQSKKKVEAVGAKEALEKAEARVKRVEVRLGRAVGDLKRVEERAKQERASSAEVVRQQAALVNLQAIYQEALGDYRRALNRVHGLGLNPGTATLEAKSLPGLEKENPVTQGTVDAKAAQSVDPIKAALGYLKATAPITATTAPGTLFGVTIPGAGIVAGRVEDAWKGVGDRKMAAALAEAQKDFVAKSRVYEMVREFESIAQRNERLARQFWLDVVAPQVENVFPGNAADLRESKNLANDAARLRDDLGKKTEEARLAVARALGRTPAEADAASVRSLSGRPPTVRWVGNEGTVSAEAHPGVIAAGAEGEAAVKLAKANAIARHMPELSFNIEEVTPSSGGAEKVAPVLRVYMNATPSLEGAIKNEAYKADERAAKLSQADRVRQIENEMDDLAKRISAGSEQLPALYETVQTARKNVEEKVAAYERYGVAETGHAVQLAGFGPVKEATDNYNKALENYAKARADFEQSLARFNNLLVILGQNPADFLQVAYEENGNPRDLALPPPSKVKDEIKIPFPGLLPGSMSRPGFTFEQRFDKTRAPNDPLADLPTQYVELDLNTGKPTGRVIDARYTVDAKDPARRTTAFIDHRPYGATDPRKTIPPTVSIFSEATLRSNPYNPYTLPDATVGWDREDGWTVQSVTRGRAGRMAVDVVTPDGKRILDEVIREGQGVRLKNQRADVRLTKVSLVTDRSGQKAIQKATEMGGRVIWEGQFTERQEPVSFVDHRNKTRGRVTGRETLPRGSTMTLPGGARAALAYGGSVVTIDGVDSQGKPMKTYDVLSDNFSSLGSVTNATVLRRDPAQPDAPAKPAVSASYTRFGDHDAAELREGAAGYQRQGNNVAFTLPDKDPYARLAYREESVYVLPTRDGGTPGLAFVSPRGGTLSTEVREGVKATGLKVEDSGTLRESMTYGAPLPNGLIPTETRNPKGSPLPGPTAFPTPSDDLMALTKRDQSAKTPEVKEREHPPAQPIKEKLPFWREWLNKVSDFFISKAGASDFEDIRATPKGLIDTDNKPVHLNGVNWRGIQYGWNFGDSVSGFARNRDWMEGELAAMKASGVNAVRIPLLDDGRHLNGDYSNFNQFKGDIQVFLDAAAKQGIHVEFVLFDFLAVARGRFDMSPKSTENFRTNFLTPFLKEFGRHPALLTIDLINEPEWILDKSVPGGWGDKMEGGRRAVRGQDYQRFVASMSNAIKDSKFKDKDGKSVAGHVMVTIGTSVKHHATATDSVVRTHLDYYSWHHYDRMGSLKDYMKSVPRDNKPFELGEYATDGTKTTPADYMRDVRTNEGGVGAFAWNWGARAGQKIDEHTTANASKLRADLKAAGEVSKDPEAKPVVGEVKSTGSAVKETGATESPRTGATPAVAPGSYRSYRAPDGTTYTPMPDGKTVIRSIGDPFDPANESDQRVIAVPVGFDFGATGAQAYLDNPANAQSTYHPTQIKPNGMREIVVYKGDDRSKPVRKEWRHRDGTNFRQAKDGTWYVTQRGFVAPYLRLNSFNPETLPGESRVPEKALDVRESYYFLPVNRGVFGKKEYPLPPLTYERHAVPYGKDGQPIAKSERLDGFVFSDPALLARSASLAGQLLGRPFSPLDEEDASLMQSLSSELVIQSEVYGLRYGARSDEQQLLSSIYSLVKGNYALALEGVPQNEREDFLLRQSLSWVPRVMAMADSTKTQTLAIPPVLDSKSKGKLFSKMGVDKMASLVGPRDPKETQAIVGKVGGWLFSRWSVDWERASPEQRREALRLAEEVATVRFDKNGQPGFVGSLNSPLTQAKDFVRQIAGEDGVPRFSGTVRSSGDIDAILGWLNENTNDVMSRVESTLRDSGAGNVEDARKLAPITAEGRATLNMLISHALRGTGRGQALQFPAEKLGFVAPLMSPGAFDIYVDRVMEGLRAHQSKAYIDSWEKNPGATLPPLTTIEDIIFAEAVTLRKLVESGVPVSPHTLDVWQRDIFHYMAVHREVAYRLYLSGNPDPKRYIDTLTRVDSGVRAHLETAGLFTVSDSLAGRSREAFKGEFLDAWWTPIEKETSADGKVSVTLRGQGPQAAVMAYPTPRDLSRDTFTTRLSIQNSGIDSVEIVAVDEFGRAKTATVFQDVSAPYQIVRPSQDAPVYLKELSLGRNIDLLDPAHVRTLLLRDPTDPRGLRAYRALSDEGFDPTRVKSITVKIISSAKGERVHDNTRVDVLDPYLQRTPQGFEEKEPSPLHLSLGPDSLLKDIPTDVTRSPNEVKLDGSAFYRLGSTQEGVNWAGHRVTLSVPVPPQADMTYPVTISVRDARGSRFVVSRLGPEAGAFAKDGNFTMTFTPKSYPDFRADQLILVEVNYFPTLAQHLGLGVAGSVLAGGLLTSLLIMLRRQSSQLRQWLRGTVGFNGKMSVWRGLWSIYRSFGAVQEQKSNPPKQSYNLDGASPAPSSSIDSTVLSRRIKESAGSIREWLDKRMGVAFDSIGKQQEDGDLGKGNGDDGVLFPPALRAVEPWEAFGPDSAPRFSLGQNRQGIVLLALGVLLHSGGFGLFLASIFPVLVLWKATGASLLRPKQMGVFTLTAGLYAVLFSFTPLIGIDPSVFQEFLAMTVSSAGIFWMLAGVQMRHIRELGGYRDYLKRQREELEILRSTLVVLRDGNPELVRLASLIPDGIVERIPNNYVEVILRNIVNGNTVLSTNEELIIPSPLSGKLTIADGVLTLSGYLTWGEVELLRSSNSHSQDLLGRLTNISHAKRYLKSRYKSFEGKDDDTNEGINKKPGVARQALIDAGRSPETLLPYIKDITRIRRSADAGRPGIPSERMAPFAEGNNSTLSEAIGEVETLLSANPTDSLSTFDKFWLGFPALNIGFIASIWLSITWVTYLIIGAVSVSASALLIAFLVGGALLWLFVQLADKMKERAVRRVMLLDVAEGRHKLLVGGARIIYGTRDEKGDLAQAEKGLKAFDVWRSLMEFSAAVSSRRPQIDQAHGNPGDIGHEINDRLDEFEDVFENLDDAAIVRGPFDTRHLSEYQGTLNVAKVIMRMVFWVSLLGIIVSTALIGIIWFGTGSYFLITDFAWPSAPIFGRTIAVVEIMKVLALNSLALHGGFLAGILVSFGLSLFALFRFAHTPPRGRPGQFERVKDLLLGAGVLVLPILLTLVYPGELQILFQGALKLFLFALAQTWVQVMVLFSFAIILAKFAYYYVGRFARMYRGENNGVNDVGGVKPVHWVLFGGLLLVSLPIFLLVPLSGPSMGFFWLTLGAKTVAGVTTFLSGYFLVALYIAQNRFFTIYSGDRLFDHTTQRPKGVTPEEWHRRILESYDRFGNSVLNRYSPEEREIIARASRHQGTRDRWVADGTFTQREVMVLESLLGRGHQLSGVTYDPLSGDTQEAMASVERAYQRLDAFSILDRMSGNGFRELKEWLSERDVRVGDDVELWDVLGVGARAHISESTDTRDNKINGARTLLAWLATSTAAKQLRDFLDEHIGEKRVVVYYDFLPKFTPWAVVVGGADATPKLMRYMTGLRYPLANMRVIFAGENWDTGTLDFIEKEKRLGTLPPNLNFEGMPIREENLRKFAAYAYTKPGANTAVLNKSDGTFGIIYDAENTPQPFQPLEFLLATLDGKSVTRQLAGALFRPGAEDATRRDQDLRAFSSFNQNGAIYPGGARRGSTSPSLLPSEKQVKGMVDRYMALLRRDPTLSEEAERIGAKQGKNLQIWMKYFRKHHLTTLMSITNNLEDLTFLSTGLQMEAMRQRMRAGADPVRDWNFRELSSLYISLATMPDYGAAADQFIRLLSQAQTLEEREVAKQQFISALMVGEFRRISEPNNGQGRLAKVNNALTHSPSDPETASAGQIAALMYAEYAGWYLDGANGFKAKRDADIPLGGTTGEFNTAPVEEISWTDPTVARAVLGNVQARVGLSAESALPLIERHHKLKNKILAMGGWDEFQVAEDYMLGFFMWYNGCNVAHIWSITTEDPAGFESELGAAHRPRQMSRWLKGYVVGMLAITEDPRNIFDLIERKGLWGFTSFLIPTLSSTILPLFAIVGKTITRFWWIFVIPMQGIFGWFATDPGLWGALYRTINENTQIFDLLLQIQTIVQTLIPDLFFFMPEAWAWFHGPFVYVLLLTVMFLYFTVRGILRPLNGRLGAETILNETNEIIETALSKKYSFFNDKGFNPESLRNKLSQLRITLPESESSAAFLNNLVKGPRLARANVIDRRNKDYFDDLDRRFQDPHLPDEERHLMTMLWNRWVLEDALGEDVPVEQRWAGAFRELMDRKSIIEQGTLEKESPGLLPFRRYLWAAAGVVGLSVAIVIAPTAGFAGAWLPIDLANSSYYWLQAMVNIAAVGFVLTAATVLSVTQLGRWYINREGDPDEQNIDQAERDRRIWERRARGIAFRSAVASLWILSYQTLYWGGWQIQADESTVKPQYTGYWWRTPRATGQIEWVQRRHVKKFADASGQNKFLKSIKDKVTGWKLEGDSRFTRIMWDWLGRWSFHPLMLLVAALGLRWDMRNYIFGENLSNIFQFGPEGTNQLLEFLYSGNNMVFVILSLLLIAVVILLMANAQNIRAWRSQVRLPGRPRSPVFQWALAGVSIGLAVSLGFGLDFLGHLESAWGLVVAGIPFIGGLTVAAWGAVERIMIVGRKSWGKPKTEEDLQRTVNRILSILSKEQIELWNEQGYSVRLAQEGELKSNQSGFRPAGGTVVIVHPSYADHGPTVSHEMAHLLYDRPASPGANPLVLAWTAFRNEWRARWFEILAVVRVRWGQDQSAIPVSGLTGAIEALDVRTADTQAMGSFLTTVLEQMPLASLDVSSQVDPLILKGQLAQDVPQALDGVGSRMGGRVGEAVEPAVHLGRMLAPGVKGQAFSSAVRNYAFALGYQMARSDNPATLVSLLQVAYLTVASRSEVVGVHLNSAGFAEAFQLGANFAQTVSVQDNEAAVFHVGQTDLAGKDKSEVLDKWVEMILANDRKGAAGMKPSPIELVSSDPAVVNTDQVRAAVVAYVRKHHPAAIDQVISGRFNIRLRSDLSFVNDKIDSVALFDQIKRSAGHVTGMACFTSQPDAWTVHDVIRLVALEKVLADVLQRLNAMKATDNNA